LRAVAEGTVFATLPVVAGEGVSCSPVEFREHDRGSTSTGMTTSDNSGMKKVRIRMSLW